MKEQKIKKSMTDENLTEEELIELLFTPSTEATANAYQKISVITEREILAREEKKSTEKTKKTKKSKKNLFKNALGLTAFQFGQKIDKSNPKIFLTAVNIALQAVRIKRDHNNNTSIFNYLLDIDKGLVYAWKYMQENGKISNFDYYLREDVEDAIQDALVILVKYHGKKYTQEAQKEARNAVGKKWTIDSEHKTNAERFNSVSLENEKEEHGDSLEKSIVSESVFVNSADDGTLHNKNLLKAMEKLSETDKYILLRYYSGDTQKDIAEDMNKTQSFVSKRIKSAIACLQNSLVMDAHGRVKLA